jgi:acetylornithine deacetylase
MQIDAKYTEATLADLVRINSINPEFSAGDTSEQAIAEHVAGLLSDIGCEVHLHEAAPGRVSTVGRLRGKGGGRSLMLYGHLDTVGVGGMADPFGAQVRDGRLYGRGAYDMKGGVAACLAAAKALVDAGASLAGDLLVVTPADEEVASIGMQQVLEHHTADGAIVTEPTALELCLAHKGFSWIEVETVGRAAHGSNFADGIDANMRMGRVLAELARHAAMLHGGDGPSIYASRCRLTVERRTIPGETGDQALAEVSEITDRLAQADDTFQAAVRTRLNREPFEVSPDAAIVRVVSEATRAVLGREPAQVGKSPWMDAALLAAAGVETVVMGATGAGAHADEEWVELESVVRLAEILARSALAYSS